ncbi:MAG TPA: glycosyltransferase family 4 protein [Chitinophagaceae bacterium]
MKPRLLIIHNRLVVGGPALDIIPLAWHLRDEFEVHILYGRREPDETEPVYMLEKYHGLTLVNLGCLQRAPHPVRDARAFLAISRYIRNFRPDIVHTHGAKVGIFGRIAARRAGVPLVIHTFHGHFFHSYFNSFLSRFLVSVEKRLANITDYIIAISSTQKADLERILGIGDPGKIKLIPLGVDYIDPSMKEHYRQAFKRTYRVTDDTICIGFVGRLVPIKNPDFFIEAVAQLLQRYSNRHLRFVIAGDGVEKQRMMERLREKHISFSSSAHDEAPVVFTGWVQNIQNVLEGMDIVVLTSYNEGTPMSLIEAQLCGIPVVAVDVGGVRDTMIAGETGLLVPRHDVQLFCDAVGRLIEQASLRKEMGAKAAAFAGASFSKEKEIGSFRELYRRAMRKRVDGGNNFN